MISIILIMKSDQKRNGDNMNNNIFDKNEYKFLLFNKPWELPKQLFKDLKYSYQRIIKGYCRKDTWSIYSWFLSVMPHMIIDMKKEGNSYPEETTPRNWKKTLNTIAYLFKEADEETCSQKNPYEYIFSDKYPREISDEVFDKYWNEEVKLAEYREECKNKGFELFSKWFYDLWD